jgi:Domain of unknown function (DUF6484)
MVEDFMTNAINREPIHTYSAAQAKSDESEMRQRVVLKFGDTRTGTLVGFTVAGDPLVDFHGNPSLGHLAARSCVDILPRDLGREVVLLFEEGDCGRPLVVGLIRINSGPTTDAQNTLSTQVESVYVARTVSACEKLVLRCGAASITLTRDGRVTIVGTHVQSSASNTNRIRGGSVQIN